MSRIQKTLFNIKKSMRGIEIGPCHRPIASKKENWNVTTVDHLSREGLIKKYESHQHVAIENIEEVDVIWNGEPLDELIGNLNSFDYIIASHVVEHTPNLVSFLNECANLLKPEGVLSLVVPDKRFCFDMIRPLSTTGNVLQAHIEGRKKHIPSNIFDEKAYACNKNGEICWDVWDKSDFNFNHSLAEAYELFNKAKNESDYTDAHAWCFTPNSFRLIIQDLNELNLTQLKESHFFDTEYCEFFFQLSKNAEFIKRPRKDLVKYIQYELQLQQII